MNALRMSTLLAVGTVVMVAVMVVALGDRAQAAGPVVVPAYASIYTISVFPGTPPARATKPDDLAVSNDGKNLWVGYGNGVDTTGKGGLSNIVEYDIATGKVLMNIRVPGHCDGLKINPISGDIWATENEDGNPTLAVIDHISGAFRIYRFDPALITGGMDDIVFASALQEASRRDPDSPLDVFITASSQVGGTAPAIVRIAGPLRWTDTNLEATLPGNPQTVWNVVTNSAEATDTIGDPDSMTRDPAGELVLDNRSDDSLYIVRGPKSQHPVLRIPLTLDGTPVEVNDTIFTMSETSNVSSTAGTIFITDADANAIYMLTKLFFPANEVYTAADVANVVGLVDLNTGAVTPIAEGFQGLHGLAFSPMRVAIACAGRTDKDQSEESGDYRNYYDDSFHLSSVHRVPCRESGKVPPS